MVSAIITTHNRKKLLKRAIESVLSQTYKDMECIVVDDASTDGTGELCKSYPIQYFYIPKEDSKGGNYARNLGIKASSGNYCAFLDDDDYWLPEKIEKQVALIKEKQCELIYCGRKLEYVNHNTIEFLDELPNPYFSGEIGLKIFETVCCTTSSAMLVLKQAIIDVGFFDENLKFWQDYELTIRLAQRKPFYFVNEPMCVYRIDTKDTNRLTNKYFDWKKSVKYIHHKHAKLYQQLTFKGKLLVKRNEWRDALIRCQASHLTLRKAYYSFLLLPFRVRKYFQITRYKLSKNINKMFSL